MISINVIKKQDIVYGFKVSGHALFDDKGKDVVCAAVSILTINTVNAFESFLPGEEIRVEADGGLIKCEFVNEPSEKAKLLIDTFLLGIRGMEKEYGKRYLKLEE